MDSRDSQLLTCPFRTVWTPPWDGGSPFEHEAISAIPTISTISARHLYLIEMDLDKGQEGVVDGQRWLAMVSDDWSRAGSHAWLSRLTVHSRLPKLAHICLNLLGSLAPNNVIADTWHVMRD